MKKNLRNYYQFFLYKTLFTPNFIRNIYKFYNIVKNNYPRKNYIPIKILNKNNRKKYFFINYFNKFKKNYVI